MLTFCVPYPLVPYPLSAPPAQPRGSRRAASVLLVLRPSLPALPALRPSLRHSPRPKPPRSSPTRPRARASAANRSMQRPAPSRRGRSARRCSASASRWWCWAWFRSCVSLDPRPPRFPPSRSARRCARRRRPRRWPTISGAERRTGSARASPTPCSSDPDPRHTPSPSWSWSAVLALVFSPPELTCMTLCLFLQYRCHG